MSSFSVCMSASESIGGHLSIFKFQEFKLAGAAVFFEDIGLGLGIKISGLLFSTLTELQTIALALECVPPHCSVCLHSNSQAVLDTYKSKLCLICPNFCNQCWVEHLHIVNIICSKNLRVKWLKVKDHLGVVRNNQTDALVAVPSNSDWFFLPHLERHCLLASGDLVSGNSRHFKVSSGSKILADLYMAVGFTNKPSAGLHMYFMKTLYYQLSVTVWKQLYSRCYLSVLCLFCGNMEVSDHVFSCKIDLLIYCQLLNTHAAFWKLISGLSCSSSCKIVNFMHAFGLSFKNYIWLVCAKYHVFMEKNRLISLNGLFSVSISRMSVRLSAGVSRLLGIADAFGIHFGFRRSCSFFSGIGNDVSVYIVA
ncbi:hypothetical protein G9A89_001511 [Geosiphon pyriformis]|nr:hypothetical protein G9A89_001511 [Geosiphon pyriformis]